MKEVKNVLESISKHFLSRFFINKKKNVDLLWRVEAFIEIKVRKETSKVLNLSLDILAHINLNFFGVSPLYKLQLANGSF
jgi:hypothetical protein